MNLINSSQMKLPKRSQANQQWNLKQNITSFRYLNIQQILRIELSHYLQTMYIPSNPFILKLWIQKLPGPQTTRKRLKLYNPLRCKGTFRVDASLIENLLRDALRSCCQKDVKWLESILLKMEALLKCLPICFLPELIIARV